MNQMSQMNHADNNNGTDQEGLDKKVEQKDENDLSEDTVSAVGDLNKPLIFDTSPYFSGFLSKIVLCFAYGSNSKVLLSVEKANEVNL